MDEEKLYKRYKTDLTTCLRQLLEWSNAQIAEEIENVDEMLDLSDDRHRALSVGPLEEGPLYRVVNCLLREKISHLHLNFHEERPIWNRIFHTINKALIDRPTRWPTRCLTEQEWADLRQKVTAILAEYDHKEPSNSTAHASPSE